MMVSAYRLSDHIVSVVIRRAYLSFASRHLTAIYNRDVLLTVWCMLMLLPGISLAQTDSSILNQRIAKSWKMDKLMQGNQVIQSGQSAGMFMIIFHRDHTMEQGLYPDGLIKCTWTADDANRIISISDLETGVVYKMKVLILSTDQLVLQDASNPGGITIYYSAHKQ